MSAALAIAAARPASSRPIPQATGTSAIPASAEGSRSAHSLVPEQRGSRATRAMYQSGGLFSVCVIDCSVLNRLGCSTCTGVKASSNQKLCRPSVLSRSAAASKVSAASGHHAAGAAPGDRAGRGQRFGRGTHRGSSGSTASAALWPICRSFWAQPMRDRAEAAVAGGAHVVFCTRRQVPAPGDGAHAATGRPRDDQADLRALLSAGRAPCCRRRRRGVSWSPSRCWSVPTFL